MGETLDRLDFPTSLAGRFRVEGLLGAGGMGRVFAAQDLESGRPVALKLLAGVRDRQVLARFLKEAALLARVEHPHVVRLLEFGEAPEGPWLSMERIEGEDLATRLSSGTPAGRALDWLLGIAGALDAVHAAGLVHRDVKPGNVRITREGRAVLVDFGLAAETDDSRTRITQEGGFVGTFPFIAPECLRGQRATPESDWYSWGVMLHLALEGRHPFTQGELTGWMAGSPLPAPAIREVPGFPKLAGLVLRQLSTLPGERLDSRTGIEAFLAGPPRGNRTPPPPPSAPPRPATPAGSSVRVASGGALASGARRAIPDPEGSGLGNTPGSRYRTAVGIVLALATLLVAGAWWGAPSTLPGTPPDEAGTAAPGLPPTRPDPRLQDALEAELRTWTPERSDLAPGGWDGSPEERVRIAGAFASGAAPRRFEALLGALSPWLRATASESAPAGPWTSGATRLLETGVFPALGLALRQHGVAALVVTWSTLGLVGNAPREIQRGRFDPGAISEARDRMDTASEAARSDLPRLRPELETHGMVLEALLGGFAGDGDVLTRVEELSARVPATAGLLGYWTRRAACSRFPRLGNAALPDCAERAEIARRVLLEDFDPPSDLPRELRLDLRGEQLFTYLYGHPQCAGRRGPDAAAARAEQVLAELEVPGVATGSPSVQGWVAMLKEHLYWTSVMHGGPEELEVLLSRIQRLAAR